MSSCTPRVQARAGHLASPHLLCRATDSLDICPIPPKQSRPENGEFSPSTTDQSMALQLSTDPSSSSLMLGSRPSVGREAVRPAGPVSPPEEDPERTKHSKMRALGKVRGLGRWGSGSRWLFDQNLGPCFLSPESGRKQKTPKKFTGEQPSISGTFGLKGETPTCWAPLGLEASTCVPALSPHLPAHPSVHTGLAKAEDKARVHRSKKQEGLGPEDVRKKVSATPVIVSKEAPTPVVHSAPGGAVWRGPRAGLSCGVDPTVQAWGFGLTVEPGCYL